MAATSTGRLLSTVFVDYDNIYLSLKRKSEDAAKAFAKNATAWLKEIESGRLITPTNGPAVELQRRIVMNRCYGNPVPRRNQGDNSTDMSSFPFVRHNFLRAGFEVVDCPPLTAQLKNSSDIRMVMDVRDYLNHDTYFEEFVILSGDADFTPLLHRLRAHARRTVIFANDYTASPYTALSDGEIRESDLMTFLLEGRLPGDAPLPQISAPERERTANTQLQPAPAQPALPSAQQLEIARRDIINEVASVVRATTHPVPLEALADRAVRNLGHEKTAGLAWGGAGTFRELLQRALPANLKLTSEPPYFVYDADRSSRQATRSEPVPQQQPAQVAAPAQAQPQYQSTPAPAYQQQPAYSQQPGYALPQQPATQQPAAQASMQTHAGYQQPQPGFGAAPRTFHQPQPTAQQFNQPPAAPSYASQPAPQVRAPAMPPLAQPEPQNPALASLQQSYRGQPPERMQEAAAPVPHAMQQHAVPQQAVSQPSMPQEPAGQQRMAAPPAVPAQRPVETASAIQQSIARIHDACQAPPLSPPEYRALFEVMAQEINSNGLLGAQTLASIETRAREFGVELRRDDVRFVLEVVSEADPWFEQGASANLFAGRFRNFVVARCRGQGLNLTADELDLIEAWFAAAPQQARNTAPATAPRAPASAPPQQQPAPPQAQGNDRWWNLDDARNAQGEGGEELPRIIRARQRG